MTTDINIFKKRLEEESEALKQQLDAMSRHTETNPDKWEVISKPVEPESEKEDAAAILEEYDKNVALVNDLQIRYRKVIDAIERINNNTYGICTMSGVQHTIKDERLMADPAARTCEAHDEK